MWATGGSASSGTRKDRQEPDHGLLCRPDGAHPAMENPTLVVMTDRNDLDDQLFGTFARCKELLRQEPVQAESRDHLTGTASVADAGGVVFTTIQKFCPRKTRATGTRSFPTAATSSSSPTKPTAASTTSSTASPATCATPCPTPRSSASPARPSRMTDANTRAVFGDYIGVYDIQRAVEDRRHRADLLRKPPGEARTRRGRDGRRSTRTSRRSPKARKSSTRRSSRPSGRRWRPMVGAEKRIGLIAQDLVEPLRDAAGGHGRQGDDRLHEPPHLR